MRSRFVGCLVVFFAQYAYAGYPTFSGSATFVGFSLENEPLQHEMLQDDSGLLFQCDFAAKWAFRDCFFTNVSLVIEGPSRYGLLISDYRTTLFGRYDAASWSDLRPRLDLASLRWVTPRKHFELEAGLIRHDINDKYANPGFNLSGKAGPFKTGFHISDVGKREGIFHQPSGLRDTLDIPDGIDARFYRFFVSYAQEFADPSVLLHALDVSITSDLLTDRTPADMRWNAVQSTWGMIARDDMGTATLKIIAEIPYTTVSATYARNFGHAETDQGDSSNRAYRGKFYDLSIRFRYGLFEISAGHMTSSGDPFETANLVDQRPPSDFLGFVDYPPTDLALYDSHYIRHDLPLVFTGGTFTPFYGLPRPGYQRDAYSIENLITSHAKLKLHLTPNFSCTLDYWQVLADQVPPMYQSNQWIRPSRDLGDEYDIECLYRVFDRMEIRFFYGIADTGRYYHDVRDYFAPGPVQSEEETGYLSGRMVHLAELGFTVWI